MLSNLKSDFVNAIRLTSNKDSGDKIGKQLRFQSKLLIISTKILTSIDQFLINTSKISINLSKNGQLMLKLFFDQFRLFYGAIQSNCRMHDSDSKNLDDNWIT